MMRVPAASFGKSERDGKEAFGLLFHTDDFPAAAIRELERLAASVQWSGAGGDEPYSDCFAAWPVGEDDGGTMVARVSDAGRDRLERMHTLRIDAGFLSASLLDQKPDLLISLLHRDAWAAQLWSGPPADLCLTPQQTADACGDRLAQALGSSARILRVFVASHPHYLAQGFNLVCGPDGTAIREAPSDWKPADEPSVWDVAVPSNKTGHPWRRRIAVVAGCTAVALGWIFWREGALHDALEREGRLWQESQSLKREAQLSTNKIAELVRERDHTAGRAHNLQQEVDDARRYNDDLKSVLSDFRLDRDPFGLRKELERRLPGIRPFTPGSNQASNEADNQLKNKVRMLFKEEFEQFSKRLDDLLEPQGLPNANDRSRRSGSKSGDIIQSPPQNLNGGADRDNQ